MDSPSLKAYKANTEVSIGKEIIRIVTPTEALIVPIHSRDSIYHTIDRFIEALWRKSLDRIIARSI